MSGCRGLGLMPKERVRKVYGSVGVDPYKGLLIPIPYIPLI